MKLNNNNSSGIRNSIIFLKIMMHSYWLSYKYRSYVYYLIRFRFEYNYIILLCMMVFFEFWIFDYFIQYVAGIISLKSDFDIYINNF